MDYVELFKDFKTVTDLLLTGIDLASEYKDILGNMISLPLNIKQN
jgi:hypothetical protein